MNNDIIPIITYDSFEKHKFNIYKDNKNKSGIYRLINKNSGKSYIGSSVCLNRRFRFYFSHKALESILTKGSNSKIYRALIKYGHSNFSLDIIEYCEPDILISKEQYYIDLINPEYKKKWFKGM